MDTVLSCSLLMAFSPAFIVFTISPCFSFSSFCAHEDRENETSARKPPAGRHAATPPPNPAPKPQNDGAHTATNHT
ncbi:hypothetical protein EYF80_062507 [Liparis tanakae]|uniref:Secreted protein n=1 Tax=Liparis tanakae TaxID=230148 RepID=A0A4Z2EF34_9TELE|nr:hypothetical protein EYF80_062507 [Liparis tanakae]